MNRRNIIIASGAAALAPPLALTSLALTPRASLAQTPRKLWRIGHLTALPPDVYAPRLDGFKAGMAAAGYAETRDYVIEIRSSSGDLARLDALAAELVALKVDLILTSGTPSVLAASRATRSIPIVMTTSGDPIGIGVAASLRRPGGNVTGMTGISNELSSKLLDLLRQMVPGLRRTGYFYDPDNPIDVLTLPRFEADCATLKMLPIRAPARSPKEFEAAFQLLLKNKAQGVYVTGGATNLTGHQQIVALAAKHRLPAMYSGSGFNVNTGALMSYGPDHIGLYRQAAAHVDRIFKGANPAELPIQQPTLFEFMVNLKTAKTLGIKVPETILIQATRVIE